MFKKLLIASVVLSASAGVAFAGHSYKDYKDVDYKKEVAPCSPRPFPTGTYLGFDVGPRTNYTGTPVVYKGLEGTLFLGYGDVIVPNFYLAGEFFAGDSINLKDFKEENGSGNGAKTSWSFGASLIPGYLITDSFLGYIRGGVVRSRFEDQSTDKTGWQVGVGGQLNLALNWDLRGEYVYSGYGTVSGIGKANSDQFNFGVVYKFL